ncbi:hypothetical protein F4809DRAFT_524303 [Biscogniauxia mediterranea]|nr:hypothetical protein F4809DRAFT_524303 [Biscogniauxia mediterranea]
MEHGSSETWNCSRVGHCKKVTFGINHVVLVHRSLGGFFFSIIHAFGFFSLSSHLLGTPHAQSLPRKTFFFSFKILSPFLNFFFTFLFCFPSLLFSFVAIFPFLVLETFSLYLTLFSPIIMYYLEYGARLL